MGEDLDDLRRRMLDRRRRHLRDRKAGNLALVATALGAGGELIELIEVGG